MSGGVMIKKIIKKITSFFKFILLEDNWKSDLAFFLLIILLIVFINLYSPFLFSVVYSNSMEHHNFDCRKYEKFNISCSDFEKFPFRNGINVGDVVIIIPAKYEELKVGDVVVYISLSGKPILHRIVQKNDTFVCIMGDNNPYPSQEECPLYDINAIKGKAIFRIPYIGYPRILIKKFLGI
ncbi:MAG: signal peptidase I [Nanopusillaceae archaeon]